MTIKPRLGFLVIGEVQNPFKSGPIDVSELHKRSRMGWSKVLLSHPENLYKEGELVYHEKSSGVPLILDNGEVCGVLHESMVQLSSSDAPDTPLTDVNAAQILASLKRSEAAETLGVMSPPPNGKRILVN